MIPIQVECHSGYAYVDRPAALYWDDNRLIVKKIIQQWRTPSGWKFLIQTMDDRTFEIAYDEPMDNWFGREGR